MNWKAPFERGNGAGAPGRGVAIGIKASISPTTSVAIINVSADGSTTLYMGTVDMGQGSDTTMAQIIAEVLGLRTEWKRGASRHRHHALRHGARSARARSSTWAMRCGSRPRMRRRSCRSSRVEAGLPVGTNYPPAEIFKKRYGMQAGNVVGFGSYIPSYKSPDPQTGLSDNVTPFWMIGGAGVEVEVDTETGKVRIIRLVNVADAGQPTNPGIARTQLSGAAVMQLGFTMFENMELDGGQVTNASLADYKIPGMWDIPPMENELVAAGAEIRTVRRQGPRRERHVRRLAGDRQCDPRRGRRAPDGTAAHRREGLPGAARSAGRPLEE